MTKKHTEGVTVRESTSISAHITRDLFCDWQKGKLKEPEEMDLFTHIGACTFCAEQFGNWMEDIVETMETEKAEMRLESVPDQNPAETAQPMQGFLEEPPGYLKEEILNRVHQIDVQASVKLKETSRQVQLMLYSLKVGFAVAASIFLLAITTNIQDMNPELPKEQQVAQMQEQRERQEQEESIVSKLRRGSKEITGLLNEISCGFFRIEMDDSENKRNQEVTR